MNPFLDYSATSASNEYLSDRDELIQSRDVRWVPLVSREQFQHANRSPERIFCVPRDNGTNPNEVPIQMSRKFIPLAEIDRLRNLYTFQDPDQIKEFLSGNNTLIKRISSIYAKIRTEFPTENIILEAVSDSPNSIDKEIVISVSTALPVVEAIERLDKVESAKWNKDSRDPYVDICLKLDYQ
ncbi:MAG TPA: hypothetical protein VMY43_07445 [Methanothrix sp.]|nr:hypothetical protein [Methanothrix sp.]